MIDIGTFRSEVEALEGRMACMAREKIPGGRGRTCLHNTIEMQWFRLRLIFAVYMNRILDLVHGREACGGDGCRILGDK